MPLFSFENSKQPWYAPRRKCSLVPGLAALTAASGGMGLSGDAPLPLPSGLT